MPNEDVPLFPSLIEGVSTGFHDDIIPSGCFPPNDKPELPSTPLSIHLANWQSAEKEPETTLALVEEEVKQGWVYKFDGSIGDAKQMFPHVAIGRLGVAFSDSRPPRLVVDSSVCGVNDRCKLPERTNPSIGERRDTLLFLCAIILMSYQVSRSTSRVHTSEWSWETANKGYWAFALMILCISTECVLSALHSVHTGGNVLADGFFDSSTTWYGFPMQVGFM